MDLATEWRSRRWRRLLNAIDRLPRDSAYVEAMSQDEDLAARLEAREEGKPRPPTRRMAEWSATVELLSGIFDRLGEVIQTTAALGGAKPRRIQRAPVPVTAAERIRRRRRMETHRSVVVRMLPHKAQEMSGQPRSE